MDVAFESLKGETLLDIKVNEDKTEVLFVCASGKQFRMYHIQDCCESVWLEDIDGDLRHLLVGLPLFLAEESTSQENPLNEYEESFTWTFYRMATIRGHVTMRWYGQSNGYYSESVCFELLKEKANVDLISKKMVDIGDFDLI